MSTSPSAQSGAAPAREDNPSVRSEEGLKVVDSGGGAGSAKEAGKPEEERPSAVISDINGKEKSSDDAGARAPPANQIARSARVVVDRGDADDSGEEDGDNNEDGDGSGGEEADGDLLVDFPDDTEELELVHSRISSLTPLCLPRFAASLKRLCLRQNFIAELDPADFHPLVHLEELDFYDNRIKSVGDALVKLDKLTVLDLSFNLLRSVPEALSTLTSLKTIYFVQNKITKINNLQWFGATLTSLELGGNRIRVIENLDALVNLEELWLGKNKIAKLENLSTLSKLRILSIQSNRIVKLEGLEGLVNLEEFYISHNGVERLEGLECNLKLRTLDVGHNRIPAVENISQLTHLEELWINDNLIPNVHDLAPQLGHITSLQTIYLEGNPCQTEDRAGYRRKVSLALPKLTQIDATFTRQP